MVCLHSHEFIHLAFLFRFNIILIVIITIIIISCFSLVLTFFFGFWFWGVFVIKIFFPIFLQKRNSFNVIKTTLMLLPSNLPGKGTFRCDDGDANENLKKAIGLISKTTTMHVQHTFRTFLCRRCATTTWHSWRFKVARLDFLGLIPSNFEH